jgi:hypothetical protein
MAGAPQVQVSMAAPESIRSNARQRAQRRKNDRNEIYTLEPSGFRPVIHLMKTGLRDSSCPTCCGGTMQRGLLREPRFPEQLI